jgi:hypothetical protein
LEGSELKKNRELEHTHRGIEQNDIAADKEQKNMAADKSHRGILIPSERRSELHVYMCSVTRIAWFACILLLDHFAICKVESSTYTYMCVCVCVCVYIYIYIYTYTYTHTYIYTCTYKLFFLVLRTNYRCYTELFM